MSEEDLRCTAAYVSQFYMTVTKYLTESTLKKKKELVLAHDFRSFSPWFSGSWEAERKE